MQSPEGSEGIDFEPVGLDRPYRVFTAKDPIRFGGGDTNLFGYVGSQPVTFTDPSDLLLGGPEGGEWSKTV
jgi:hypothetical protein